jgi:sporulation protein YlmC with PRC-barrel domain
MENRRSIMKRLTPFTLSAALVALVCLPVWAQQVEVDTPRAEVQVGNDNDNTVNPQHDDKQKYATPVRVSQLIGMDVRNHENEDIGDIEDLVIDPKSGQIRYAAISMGGFLGLGDELFAVPWKAVKVRVEADDRDEYVAVVNIDKARMENARGFDQDNWPNFGDERWQRENDKRFHIEVDARNPEGRDVDVNVERRNGRVLPRVEVERDR